MMSFPIVEPREPTSGLHIVIDVNSTLGDTPVHITWNVLLDIRSLLGY